MREIRQLFAVSGLINPGFLGEWKQDILPPNFMKDLRNDNLFYSLLTLVVFVFLGLFFSKIKIMGKTLAEYLKPIRYYILISVLTVISQYVVNFSNAPQDNIFLRLTQIIWELMVVLSVYKLIQTYADFKFINVLFTGVLYSFIIHGLKVSIRYFFYSKTIYYVLDRFLYGGLLVMVVAAGAGIVFLYVLKQKSIRKNN
ncbi:MAG: Uncharacterized protein Athens071426_279 [Parcubacteria group bacterium Athens0714_26]|nr:MAG: Uncharacterized protein Athens101426_507 [Parcubacteria group bacterium Athens1014_26]TSD03257.1 MAG: Uncharacterized protein Athens071426_279 [Parcubacteria group bacterium Athens0714_26]